MSDAAVLQKVQELTKAVEHLQERIEDLEDLQAAIAENGNEPLVPWAQAKAELDLD